MKHYHRNFQNLRLPASQLGYTFIELIIVVLIIMMLAANSVPRYIKLTHETRHAALAGLASSLSSVSTMNYVASKGQFGSRFKVSNCIDVLQGMEHKLPRKYKVIPQSIPAGKTVGCTLVDENNNSAVFMAAGTQ